MNNYLTSSNPFNLPAPPAWWLRAMFDFDAALVVFPSVLRRTYILARRRGFSNVARLRPLVKLNNDLLRLTAGTDGDLMAANNLVFVDTIIGWGIWSNAIFNQLRARDIWAQGGSEKYIELIEGTENAEREARIAKRGADMEHRAADAWRSLKARTGQRTRMTIPSTRKSTSSSTVGSGFAIASAFNGDDTCIPQTAQTDAL